MDHGIFKLAALLFACAFYAAVLAWRFRGVLADSARALLGGWRALTPLGRLAAAVCPPDETRRGYFANHLYVVDAGGNVHDACVGPELGTRGITPYLRSVIDYSTPNEADRGNYHTNSDLAGATEIMNKNFPLK